jgi:hypothetical protein
MHPKTPLLHVQLLSRPESSGLESSFSRSWPAPCLQREARVVKIFYSEISAVNDVGDRHQGKRSDLGSVREHLLPLEERVRATEC